MLTRRIGTTDGGPIDDGSDLRRLVSTSEGFVNWITEDIVQRLYASRQDLVEAAEADPTQGDDLAIVADELLTTIRRLKTVAAGVLDPSEVKTIDRVRVSVAEACGL